MPQSVALKVIHAHLARQDEFVSMFVDEATLSSKIHDPHVVHVEDLGKVGNVLFLAMEYVHGVALASVLEAARTAKRRLAPSLVAHIGAQIAGGLHAAHETTNETGTPLGIVHRDVSPQNVLVAFKGHVKVIDFGVAKAYGKQHETDVGTIQGKIGYMRPEQASSEPIDRRADVYALGIVLWEMLAGKRLFEAEHELALLERVRHPRVEPPSRFVEGIPPALDAAVMRMLAPRKEDRPATALDARKLLLDAVPEARSVEAHDVAALLRALVPNEIDAQNKMLSTLEEPEPAPAVEDDPTTTERHVDPTEALHQLTVPAVVRSPAPAAPRPRTGVVALVAGIAVLGVVVFLLFSSSSSSSGPKKTEPAVTFPDPPPLPSSTFVEPAPPSASASVTPKVSAKPPAVVKKKTPAAPSASASKKRCEVVNGVELCE